jgi:hypothetical protein
VGQAFVFGNRVASQRKNEVHAGAINHHVRCNRIFAHIGVEPSLGKIDNWLRLSQSVYAVVSLGFDVLNA